MVNGVATALWNLYKSHVRKILFPGFDDSLKDISYWRNEIFFNILSVLAPVSIIAVVPGVFMSFKTGIPLLGFVDLFAFGAIIIIMTVRAIDLKVRKAIFILVFYCLSICLLYYLGSTGPGLLFLLATTIFSSIIYSATAAYYTAWANMLICIVFGLSISLKLNTQMSSAYNIGTWIAVSSNVVLLSFVCAACLDWLLKGLKNSLNNFQKIMDSSLDVICTIDEQGKFVAVSEASSIIWGLKPKEVIGRNFIDFVFADDIEKTIAIGSNIVKGLPVTVFENRYVKKDGKIVYMLWSANWDVSEKIAYCIAKDVTEARIAEKEREKLVHDLQLRNDELEQFAYVASHDLQEPLRMISSFMTQLDKRYSDVVDERGRQYIHFAVDGAKRMRNIILDLLDFSRIGKMEGELVEIDCNDLVNELLILLRKKIQEVHGKIVFNGLPIIQAYKTPVRQIFQNLISNGLKYHKRGEKPVIEISCVESITQFEFSIKDNGIGISPEYFDKIFIMFQRLHNKEEYSGTGMGLAIVKKTVENLGGKVWVVSTLGEGSTFYFTLLKDLK